MNKQMTPDAYMTQLLPLLKAAAQEVEDFWCFMDPRRWYLDRERRCWR